jgi:hypothetical protein
MARERSAGSEIAANAAGDCNVLEGCAKPQVDPMTQKSNAMAASARMSPHSIEDNRSPEDNAAPTRLSFARPSCRIARTGAPGLWLSR